MTDAERARIALLIGKIDIANGDEGDEFPAVRREMLWEVADELRIIIGSTPDGGLSRDN